MNPRNWTPLTVFSTAQDPMTVEEAAEYLGVSPQTVYGYFRDGLEARRLGKRGKRLYTTREAIDRFSQPYIPERDDKPSDAQKELKRRFGI